MRYLWINRSNRPHIVTLSQFFLSVTTGLFMILHYRFLVPLIALKDGIHLQLAMIPIIIIAVVKCLLLLLLILVSPAAKKDQENSERRLSEMKVIYPGLTKGGLYLSIVTLIANGRYLSMTMAVTFTMCFVFWLHYCPKDNQIVRLLWKGRSYSSNNIKMSIIYVLIIIAIFLQPFEYIFTLELHLQIFIIFTAILLIFSYFYLHKIVLTFNVRQKSPRLILWESLYQTIFFLLFLLYLALIESQDFNFEEQFSFVLNNWWQMMLIAVTNTLYEMVLWEHIKKVAFNQLVVSLTTGFIWFNIYQMAHSQIDMRLYISVIIMIVVLLVNIGLFSEQNFRLLQRLMRVSKKTSRKASRYEQHQNQKAVVDFE